MPEITIPLPSPVTTPAVAEKEFKQLYINLLLVQAYSMNNNDFIEINYSPFDKETGEKLKGDNRSLKLPFWETVNAVPEAAAAFAAVAAAVPVLIARYEALPPP